MSGTLLPIVQSFQTALDVVAVRTQSKLNIELAKAELELSATVSKAAKAGLKFHFIFDIDIGGSVGISHGNTLSVTLTPVAAKKLASTSESDDLADAIIAAAEEVLEVSSDWRSLKTDWRPLVIFGALC